MASCTGQIFQEVSELRPRGPDRVRKRAVSATIYGELKNQVGTMALVRGGCKKISCDYCGPKVLKKYRKAIAAEAERLGLRRFMTLTLDPAKLPEMKSPNDSVDYIKNCFAKFRVYLGREFKDVKFICVLEFHPGTKGTGEHKAKGLAHLHILVNHYIAESWIREKWSAVGGGEIVEITRIVDVHRLYAYVSKYVTKEALIETPKGKKKFTASRGIVLNPKSGWKVHAGAPSLWYDILRSRGVLLNREEYYQGVIVSFCLDKNWSPFERPGEVQRPKWDRGYWRAVA